jgi:hypothetical protein
MWQGAELARFYLKQRQIHGVPAAILSDFLGPFASLFTASGRLVGKTFKVLARQAAQLRLWGTRLKSAAEYGGFAVEKLTVLVAFRL